MQGLWVYGSSRLDPVYLPFTVQIKPMVNVVISTG